MQYNQRLTAFMAFHHLLQSLHQLYSGRTGDFTPAQAQRLQGLDTLCSQGMQYAKKKCRKFAMGKVEYSPVVASTRLQRWLWQKNCAPQTGPESEYLSPLTDSQEMRYFQRPLCRVGQGPTPICSWQPRICPT
jgi:hypothetical protein